MSGVDKAKNAVEDMGGKAKEAIGKVSAATPKPKERLTRARPT
jgi:uncharacterized protein YjbJ (UPF0337 family)